MDNFYKLGTMITLFFCFPTFEVFACLFICMWPGVCMVVPLAVCPTCGPFLAPSQVYHNPSLKVWTYQGNIRSLFRFLTTTMHGPS